MKNYSRGVPRVLAVLSTGCAKRTARVVFSDTQACNIDTAHRMGKQIRCNRPDPQVGSAEDSENPKHPDRSGARRGGVRRHHPRNRYDRNIFPCPVSLREFIRKLDDESTAAIYEWQHVRGWMRPVWWSCSTPLQTTLPLLPFELRHRAQLLAKDQTSGHVH